MEYTIIFIGTIALTMWLFIWVHASRSPLGWISPISLLSFGVVIFYILPSIYWQFRPWTHFVPPYFEGLPLVLMGTIVLGLPFLFVRLRRRKAKTVCLVGNIQTGRVGSGLWLCVLPVLVGLGWKIHLLTLGFQSRLDRLDPALFGSKELAFLIGNVGYYYSPFYFLLVAIGNRRQRRIGILLWICDGIYQMLTLHRHAMLFFVFRSIIFVALLGVKMSKKQWMGLALFFMFVIAIIGRTPTLVRNMRNDGSYYLSPGQVVEVVGKASALSLFGEISYGKSFLTQVVDDTMVRLYDARSASAVMMNVPNVIPYYYGETFLHLFYSVIPRYFWPEKPSLRKIHLLTTVVMPNDAGLNPTGTIAELYINGNFIVVFFGGLLLFLICRWIEGMLLRSKWNQYIFVCVYPIMSQWILGANYNFTQRLSEGVRIVIFIWLFSLFIRFVRFRWVVRFPNPAKTSLAERGVG